MFKIFLVSKASGNGFSVEAGLADGLRHFDHHGPHADNPAPCCDDRIPVLAPDNVVEISHIDADSFVGLLRFAGRPVPQVDLGLMAIIDLGGSSICSDRFNRTMFYMVGVGELARSLKFPRPSAEGPVDVSELVEAMMAKTEEEITRLGFEVTEKAEASYRNCRKAISGKVGLWAIGASDPLDPSRPYEDGVDVVVVYRTHYESISIYCNPKSEFAYGGKTVAGVQFAGHPKAAGSPRGVAFTERDAARVFAEIAATL